MAKWKVREIPAAIFVMLCILCNGLALLIWPFAAVADVMSLGGYSSGKESTLLILVSRSFFIGSLAYPLVGVPCLIAARRFAARKRGGMVAVASVIPVAYLVVLVILFWIW